MFFTIESDGTWMFTLAMIPFWIVFARFLLYYGDLYIDLSFASPERTFCPEKFHCLMKFGCLDYHLNDE